MLIKLQVHAGSRVASLVKKADAAYEVWVRAPAKRGLANKAAVGILAKALSQEAGNLRIIKGRKSPNKIVEVL